MRASFGRQLKYYVDDEIRNELFLVTFQRLSLDAAVPVRTDDSFAAVSHHHGHNKCYELLK